MSLLFVGCFLVAPFLLLLVLELLELLAFLFRLLVDAGASIQIVFIPALSRVFPLELNMCWQVKHEKVLSKSWLLPKTTNAYCASPFRAKEDLYCIDVLARTYHLDSDTQNQGRSQTYIFSPDSLTS